MNSRICPAVVATVLVSVAGLVTASVALAAQPTIDGLSPSSGPVGTVITITGNGLQSVSAAWIGAGHDAQIEPVDASRVRITVPADATSGQIALQANGQWAFSSTTFKLTDADGHSKSAIEERDSAAAAPGKVPAGSTAALLVHGAGAPNPGLAVRVEGNHLIDAAGKPLQLRGVNVSGLEFVAIAGWIPADPWGGGSPNWNAIHEWHANSVRIPLNEASWLGYKCTDPKGATRDPDPGHNYQDTVARTVRAATAAGFYVILDLHLAAPAHFCPLMQGEMADVDNSVEFWKTVATKFKSYPNVMFELFNEPFFYWLPKGENQWQVLLNGGVSTEYVTGGNPYTAKYETHLVGMQQLLDTVRDTGATNVVLVGTPSWAADTSQWLAYRPKDRLGQMAVVWHAYPASGAVGDPKALVPSLGAVAYGWAEDILKAGFPIVMTETADHNAPGTVGAPFLTTLLPWADAHNISYLGWTWNVWQNPDNVLIKDAAGTPTDGYGQYFKQHLLSFPVTR